MQELWKTKGEEYTSSKLTDKEVEEIIELLRKGEHFQSDIAKRYNVSSTTICNIKRNNHRNDDKLNIRKSMKGSENPFAKLNEEIVYALKTELQKGTTFKRAAEMFGIGKTLVQQIAAGVVWSHVEHPYVYKKKNVTKLNETLVREIKQKLRDGTSARKLSEEYTVSYNTIAAIKQGKRWGHVE